MDHQTKGPDLCEDCAKHKKWFGFPEQCEPYMPWHIDLRKDDGFQGFTYDDDGTEYEGPGTRKIKARSINEPQRGCVVHVKGTTPINSFYICKVCGKDLEAV